MDKAVAASQFWDLANGVTVFAVIQMIAYLMSLGAKDSPIRPGVAGICQFVLSMIVVATLFYCVVIGYFSWCHWHLAGAGDQAYGIMLTITALLRIAVVLLAGVGGFCVTKILCLAPKGSAPKS